MVRILRIVFPVVAILTVGWLFVSAQTVSTDIGEIDLGEVGLNGTELTMRNPSLSGFNENGTSYDVTAVRAIQDMTTPRLIRLEDISGTMTKPDGSTVRLSARNGLFDSDAQTLKLDTRIVVDADDGSRATLQAADVDLQAGSIVSSKPVVAETPSGRIRADSVDIQERGAHMLFKGRVVVDLRLDGGKLKEDASDDTDAE